MYQLLNGIRILDLTRLLPGGYASQLLADLGAEVLKVEDPWQGDYLRWMKPYLPGTKESALYWALNRNKKSLTLNLKSSDGRKTFLRLVTKYDVVLEGFRPGVMDSLGLSYKELQKVNPSVILCSISGYGQSGPYNRRSGHDINYLALSGALNLTGQAAGAPVPPAVQVADIGGGALMAVTGILSAYIARLQTGRGQYIDVSMLDGVISWMAMLYAQQAVEDSPVKRGEGILNGGEVCYGIYETRDARFMSLGALEPKFWQAFCQAIDRNDLADKQFTHDPSVLSEVQTIFKTRTQEEWTAFFNDKDVCCEPVLELSEVRNHPQIQARNLFDLLRHPNGMLVEVLSNPLKFAEKVELPNQIPPRLGEHTREILQDLRFTPEEIKMYERAEIE
ncbi:putative acyl-CoA transferase/carnitine dehydratase [Desulfosporosinus orientis DSM 765]|uniref:Putative acyl-CoA transferase/carnitine dehydratase n=1 Tax=Desulfosporosinus orientis (strain ATCC 19365 / DSM 765 / NCIMB 8382 / VKM B-1628 / Singapore I) TaxID=768706 RepID=G7WE01_DESOD|nr:CaiB/BaiF CoA-transferase family protein [Desulfosporosinus orientis]AET69399.1 putative acyl-CoA transferase/carnitine dehydratase [Desulfosporosinus orientis DSM 765]